MLPDHTAPRILAVDDDPLMRVVLEENLVEAGCRVWLAEDGEDAWRQLEGQGGSIECLVLDRIMPKLDGMGLLARVKSDGRYRHLPVIFETSAGEPTEMAEGIAAGAYYYLVKPFDAKLLVSLVRSAVGDYRNIRGHEASQSDLGAASLNLREAAFEIRTLDEIHRLVPMLAEFFPDPQRVNLGILELLVNAVEHGNLGIDYAEKTRLMLDANWTNEIERRLALPENVEKRVHISFKRDDERARLRIRDEGHGFDWHRYLAISADRALDPNGRGIAMSRMISFDKLEYLGIGNEVEATVFLA